MRVQERYKDDLSRPFRSLYKEYENRVSLEDDILGNWKLHHPKRKNVFSDYIAALSFRNWLAHGRYWTPRFGRRFDFGIVYLICSNVYNVVDNT